MGTDEGTGLPEGSQDESQSDKGGTRSTDSVIAEFSRKTSKLAEENAALNQKIDQMMALMTAANQGGSQNFGSGGGTEALSELIYKDPEEYARRVTEAAVKQADQVVSSRLNSQNEAQAVLSQLAADYPELNDASSELTKKAVSIYNSLPNQQKSNPLAYKIAVRDAAADMGILIKSKRPSSSNDEFMMQGGSSGSSNSSKSKDGKVDPASLAFAKLVGLNTEDKDLVKRLQKHSNRKSWNRWE